MYIWIFHILKINGMTPFCNLFMEHEYYFIILVQLCVIHCKLTNVSVLSLTVVFCYFLPINSLYCVIYWWCLCVFLYMCVASWYRLWGSNAPLFMCWFWCYINCLFVYLLNFLSPFLFSLLSSFVMLSFLLIYFLTCLLPDLSKYFFQNRPVLFPGQRS